MTHSPISDPFAGTVYRDLVSAVDAAENARYYADICGDTGRACAAIDDAIRALTTARRKLVTMPTAESVQ